MSFNKVSVIIGVDLSETKLYNLCIQLGLVKVPEGKNEEEFIAKMDFQTSVDFLEVYLEKNFGLDLVARAHDDDVKGLAVIGITYKTHKCIAAKSGYNDTKGYRTFQQFFQSQNEKKATKKSKILPDNVPVKLFSVEEKQESLIRILEKVGTIEPTFQKFYLKNGCFCCF